MNKLSRRQVLLAGFATGAGISITTSRLRPPPTEEVEGSDMAYQADTSANKIAQLKQSVNLKQPALAYNREISKLLVRCCRLATEQYLQGIENSNYNGAIASLDSYFSQLERYEQITTFQTYRERSLLEPIIKKTPLGKLIPKTDLIFHGYILKSPQNNIIVFRGTQEPEEWIANINAEQRNYQADKPSFGKVHQGFYSLYSKHLAQPFRKAIAQLDPNIPCYITGHSLGGAMAILAAFDLAYDFSQFRQQIQMYSYASPRVGNPNFAQSFNDLVPNSYRIVNYADSTWLLPPTQFNESIYFHVGQAWSFVNQTGDLNPNHQLAAYQAAIDKEVETSELPIDPFSSF